MGDFQRFWLDIGQSLGLLFGLSAIYYGVAVFKAMKARKQSGQQEKINIWETIERARYTRPLFWILAIAMIITLWWASFSISRFMLGLLYALWYMEWSLTQMKRTRQQDISQEISQESSSEMTDKACDTEPK